MGPVSVGVGVGVSVGVGVGIGERERGREGEREIIEVVMTYVTQLLTSTQRLLYIFKLYP